MPRNLCHLVDKPVAVVLLRDRFRVLNSPGTLVNMDVKSGALLKMRKIYIPEGAIDHGFHSRIKVEARINASNAAGGVLQLVCRQLIDSSVSETAQGFAGDRL